MFYRSVIYDSRITIDDSRSVIEQHIIDTNARKQLFSAATDILINTGVNK
jgi:hypothetical protein